MFEFVFGMRTDEKNATSAILHVRALRPLDVQTKAARNRMAVVVGAAGDMDGRVGHGQFVKLYRFSVNVTLSVGGQVTNPICFC